MIWIILAAGLGAQLIVVVLLFRRLRGNLNRQLRDMRAEHNSELILRALREAPEPRHQAVQAANGSGLEPPPTGPPPARRKKHLGLYIGGAVAALAVALGQAVREIWQAHRGQLVGAVVGTAAAATTTVTLLTVTPWQQDGAHPRPPSSAPTAGPTAPLPPGYTQPPPGQPGQTPTASPSSSPSGSTSASPSPSASPSALPSPSGITAVVPIDEQPPTEAAPEPTDSAPPSAPPGGDSPEPSPTGGETPSPPPATAPPAQPPVDPAPAQTPVGSALRASVTLTPLLGVGVCLLGGG